MSGEAPARRRALCGLLAFWFVGSAAAAGQSEQAARELLEVMGAADLSRRAIEQTVEHLVRADPGMADYRALLLELLERYAGWQAIESDLVALYGEAFTPAELEDIAAFYRSAAGRKLLERQVDLTVRMSQMTRDRMLRHQREIELALQLRQRQLEQAGATPGAFSPPPAPTTPE